MHCCHLATLHSCSPPITTSSRVLFNLQLSAMDLLNKLLNAVAPPVAVFSLCFLLPPYLLLKSMIYVASLVLPSEDVAGKVVLITGASSGIGEHLAYEYASRGARLALVARRGKRLQYVVDRALEIGSPDVITILADVQIAEDCKRIVDETVNHFGRLDHVVCNAGIQSTFMFEESPDITPYRAIMDTNFWGSAHVSSHAVPHLRESGGKIIAISSAAAWMPLPRMSLYNASKAAMFSFFETLRVEVGSDIHILIVTPGFIESEMTQGKMLKDGRLQLDQELRDVQVGAVPVGSVSNCARAIVSSACRGDKYLTEPAWFTLTWLWKVFFPDILEWFLRNLYLPGSQEPATAAATKRLLDLSGTKGLLYPETIQMDQIKKE